MNPVAVLVGSMLAYPAIIAIVGTKVHNKRFPKEFTPPGIMVVSRGVETNEDFPELRVQNFDVYVCAELDNADGDRELQSVIEDFFLDCGDLPAVNGGLLLAAFQDSGSGSDEDNFEEDTEWPSIKSKWQITMCEEGS